VKEPTDAGGSHFGSSFARPCSSPNALGRLNQKHDIRNKGEKIVEMANGNMPLEILWRKQKGSILLDTEEKF
jgi:hypothetical protein